jgi:GntR family transcriptional regulator
MMHNKFQHICPLTKPRLTPARRFGACVTLRQSEMSDLDGNAVTVESASLWTQVMETIRERVSSGVYPVGSTLPREIDLALELGVSRNTIREATRRLSDEGLLNRRKRSGTRVISSGLSPELRLDLDPQISLRSLSKTSDIEIVRRDRTLLPDEMAVMWSESQSEEWVRVEYLRVTPADRLPLSWTTIYLPPDLDDIGEMVGRRRKEFFRLIEERRDERMSRTRTQIAPTTLGAEIAAQLGLDKDELALRVSHAMLNDEGACREIVVSVYPARHYRFEISFNLQEPK